MADRQDKWNKIRMDDLLRFGKGKVCFFLVLLLLSAAFVSASECNETRQYHFENQTSSPDYNVTVTQNCGDESEGSGSIAVTLFVLSVTFALFLLPFNVVFSKSEILNFIISRCCWVLASVLMAFNSGIMASVVVASSLDLTGEMFRYMWFFGWACYLLAVWLVLGTFFKALNMWRVGKRDERTGEF